MKASRIYLLAFLLFVGNDWLFRLASGTFWVYGTDYLVKGLAVAALWLWGVQRWADPRPPRPAAPLDLALWGAFAVSLNLLFDKAKKFAEHEMPVASLFEWPPIDDPLLLTLDATFGLMLTALAEELIFRRLAWHALARRFPNETARMIVSSILFGLIHWGNGPWAVIATALGGAALWLAYRRTGSLGLAVICHYLIDAIIFY